MVDIFTTSKRSDVMSRIRSKNTKPELKMRRLLSDYGIRYRLNDTSLPGKPDITIKRLKIAIRVNGCFWHNHKCRNGKLPATRTDFWTIKVTSNAKRDFRDARLLRMAGWSVLTVWECELGTTISPRVIRIVERVAKLDESLGSKANKG